MMSIVTTNFLQVKLVIFDLHIVIGELLVTKTRRSTFPRKKPVPRSSQNFTVSNYTRIVDLANTENCGDLESDTV
jgi:hypothetical protein